MIKPVAVPDPVPDPLLLGLLVCPLTGGNLEWRQDDSELVSASARAAFPVRSGIPIMVGSETRQLPEAGRRKR